MIVSGPLFLIALVALLAFALFTAFESDERQTGKTKPAQQCSKTLHLDNKRFSFKFVPKTKDDWIIRATYYPPVTGANRSRCPSKTHVERDGTICTTNKVESLDRAKAIAEYWATGYLSYLETGVFPDKGGEVEV